MLTWLHFGDLHASDEDGWESVTRLKALAADANRHLAGRIDFAFLPGDTANHGRPEQYQRVRRALDGLQVRWFAIPGDHDFEPHDLTNFNEGLGVAPAPREEMIQGRLCLFLDIVSAGAGGPDFRLGPDQTTWLREALARSRSDAERPAVLMHAFPGDLHEGAYALASLFADYGVASVDTGHTHYNEVLNDGGVIYTATRSTGQIEEGPVGFSLHVLDGQSVSWRFKPLEKDWPFVLITAPADHRLITGSSDQTPKPGGQLTVRAKVFGDDVETVSLSVDGGPSIAMSPTHGEAAVWTATAPVETMTRKPSR